MTELAEIPLTRLALCFVPALFVCYRLSVVTRTGRSALYALSRMALQLSLVGYALVFVFALSSPWPVLGVLTMMVVVASFIALRPLKKPARDRRWAMLLSLLCGPGSMLLLVTQFVLPQRTWYEPGFVIPLAGMIIAQTMNALSVAAERYERELAQSGRHDRAQGPAMTAGTISITNSLLAVGLVSLPGLMTGQILAGVSPLIAARYQIMVMCVLFGSSGIAISTYLYWLKRSS